MEKCRRGQIGRHLSAQHSAGIVGNLFVLITWRKTASHLKQALTSGSWAKEP